MSDPRREVRDPLLGRALGRFVLRARLGAGATGSVYRAEEAGTGAAVAIKILLPDVAHNPMAVKRLVREAEFARRISHPNVVRVVEAGEHDGMAFVAMELIAGRSLDEVIAREGALDPERAGRITLGVLAALVEAHAQSIVHRDLKPANVMLEERGGAEVAKLVDFGVARVLDDDGLAAPLTRLTREGFTVGTPAYMAPEQFGSAAVGPEADLYSVGLILHEMLAGTPAYGGSLREVILKQMTEPPPRLPDYGGLGPLVQRLTAKEVVDRPRAAAMVYAELSQLLAGMQRTTVTTVRRSSPAIAGHGAPRGDPGAERTEAAAVAPTALRLVRASDEARVESPLGDPRGGALSFTDAAGISGVSVVRTRAPGAARGPWAALAVAVVALGGAGAWLATRPPQVSAPVVRAAGEGAATGAASEGAAMGAASEGAASESAGLAAGAATGAASEGAAMETASEGAASESAGLAAGAALEGAGRAGDVGLAGAAVAGPDAPAVPAPPAAVIVDERPPAASRASPVAAAPVAGPAEATVGGQSDPLTARRPPAPSRAAARRDARARPEAARRRADPCRAGPEPTADDVQSCIDRVDAALRAGAPPSSPLWTRYADLWSRADAARTSAERARLLAELAALPSALPRPP